MKLFKIFAIILIGGWLSLAQAKVKLSLSETQIVAGDTVQLRIAIPDPKDITPPNLHALEENFEILGRAESQRISIINGETTRELQWTYTLAPKSSGTLKIPALKIGREWTDPLEITIKNDPAQLTKASPVFLETSLEPQSAYVQSQVHYRVKLYYSENIMNGSLTDPEAKDTIISHLKQDKHYEATRNGKNYQVLERDYVLFPEKSGELIIKGPEFSGIRAEINQAFQHFDPFFSSTGLPVKLYGEKRRLTILPIPANISPAEWLPAKSVTLQESWEMPKDLSEGQPIVRHISLKARGVTQAQLPEFTIDSPEGVKVYPEDPQYGNYAEDEESIAEKSQKLTYIPTHGGQLTLPSIKVHWWDPKTKTPQVAELPSKTVQVVTSAAKLSNASHAVDADTTAPSQKATSPLPQTVLATHSAKTPWIALTGFLLWALTCLAWWWQRNRDKRAAHTNEATLFKAVLTACRAHKIKATQAALIRWGEARFGKAILNLSQLAEAMGNERIKEQITELETALYKEPLHWDGSVLAKELEKYQTSKRRSAKKPAHPLEGLYPS